MSLTEPQRALAEAMSDISEYCWFARWLIGTEYHLWHFVTNPSDHAPWGNYPVSGDSRKQLRHLSDAIGGWIHWPEQADATTFIAMGEWQEKFDAWAREREAGKESLKKLPRRYADYPAWFAKQQSVDGQGDD